MRVILEFKPVIRHHLAERKADRQVSVHLRVQSHITAVGFPPWNPQTRLTVNRKEVFMWPRSNPRLPTHVWEPSVINAFHLLAVHYLRNNIQNPFISCHIPEYKCAVKRVDCDWSGVVRCFLSEPTVLMLWDDSAPASSESRLWWYAGSRVSGLVVYVSQEKPTSVERDSSVHTHTHTCSETTVQTTSKGLFLALVHTHVLLPLTLADISQDIACILVPQVGRDF